MTPTVAASTRVQRAHDVVEQATERVELGLERFDARCLSHGPRRRLDLLDLRRGHRRVGEHVVEGLLQLHHLRLLLRHALGQHLDDRLEPRQL